MPNSFEFNPVVTFDQVATIDAATTSDKIDIRGTTLVGIITPATIAGTTLTIEATTSNTDTDFRPYLDKDGNALSINITANSYIYLPPSDTAALQFFRIVSDATEAADTQFIIATRPV